MNPDFHQIRALIERRYRRRTFFSLHFLVFMIVVGITFGWISTHYVYPGDWKNVWYLVGWGAILLVHWLYYRLMNDRDREVESAWERVYGKAESDAEDQYAARLVSARLYADEDVEVQDEWIEEKPKRTLH